MTHSLKIAAAALAVFLAGAGSVSAQAACESYRVQKGDSLHIIAERVEGLGSLWDIYRENRRTIGRNPNILQIGLVLQIPCVAGSENADAGPGAITEAAPVSFLTANGFAPYTEESLKNRGLFTHLVEQAMVRAAPDAPFEIVFVNDRAAHLDVLLPRGAFDAGFPWPTPDCGGDESGGGVCADYYFSDPFYEIVDGFFSRAGDGFESVIDPAGFAGATVCRPEGHSAERFASWGREIPGLEIIDAPAPEDCFDRLMRGDADLVALETRTGEHVLNKLGLDGQVVENQHFFNLHPLVVAVHKSNPRGQEIIGILNRGLKTMLESGEWDSIVSVGLGTPKANLTN